MDTQRSAMPDATAPATTPQDTTPILTLSEWAEQAPPTADPLDTYRGYSKFAKTSLLKQGLFSQEAADELDAALIEHAASTGHDLGEDPVATFRGTPDDPDLDAVETHAIHTKDDRAGAAAREYKAMLNPTLRASYDDKEEYERRLDEARLNYQTVATPELRNAANKSALNRGDRPFALFTGADEKGNPTSRLDISPTLAAGMDDKKLAAMFEANPNLDHNQISAVRGKLLIPDGFSKPVYMLDRQQDFSAAFSALLSSDKKMASAAADISKSITNADTAGGRLSARSLDEAVGSNVLERLGRALDNTPLAQEFTPQERKDYLRDYLVRLTSPGVDNKNLDANFQKLSTGEYHVPMGLMLNKSLFDKAVTGSKVIPEAQKGLLAATRESRVSAVAPSTFKVIATKHPEFLGFYQKRKDAGESNATILDAWMSDPKNHSTTMDYLKGTGESVLEGFGGLVLYPLALAGSQAARDTLANLQKSDADRRAYAQLFGANLGAGYDLARLVAPVAADVVTTFGVGAAVKEALRATAGISLRAAIKDTLGTALRSETKSALKNFTLNAAARDFVADSATKLAAIGDKAGGKIALKSIKDQALPVVKAVAALDPDMVLKMAGNDIARNLTKTAVTASYLSTAFNRSAGSTYIQLHSTLSEQKDSTGAPKYTQAQVREIALGHALLSGTVTAAVTGGFTFLGMAGLEAVFNRGVTRTQMSAVLAKIKKDGPLREHLKAKGVDLATVDTFMDTAVRSGAKPLWRTLTTGAAHEAPEEGLDQFINYFHQQQATGDKINIGDAVKQAGYAAFLGGVMGAGVPGVMTAFSGKLDAGEEAVARRGLLFDAAAMAENRAKSMLPAEGERQGVVLYHGGLNEDTTFDNIDLGREGTQQNKRGRSYGGFYLTDESSRSWAEKYAADRGAALHKIVLKPEARILEAGEIDRLSKEQRDEMAKSYDAVHGTDVMGRSQWVLLNKDAVASFGVDGQQDTYVGRTPEASQQPQAGSAAGNGTWTGGTQGGGTWSQVELLKHANALEAANLTQTARVLREVALQGVPAAPAATGTPAGTAATPPEPPASTSGTADSGSTLILPAAGTLGADTQEDVPAGTGAPGMEPTSGGPAVGSVAGEAATGITPSEPSPAPPTTDEPQTTIPNGQETTTRTKAEVLTGPPAPETPAQAPTPKKVGSITGQPLVTATDEERQEIVESQTPKPARTQGQEYVDANGPEAAMARINELRQALDEAKVAKDFEAAGALTKDIGEITRALIVALPGYDMATNTVKGSDAIPDTNPSAEPSAPTDTTGSVETGADTKQGKYGPVPSEGIGSVYEGTHRGEKVWMSQSGEKRGFGDGIHKTEQEALDYASLETRNRESHAKALADKVDREKANQEAENARLESLSGFLASTRVSKMQQGKMREALDGKTAARRNTATGKTYAGPRHAVIKEMVADGYTGKTEATPNGKTEYRIVDDTGSYWPITKTEYEYARWLADKPPTETITPSEDTPVGMNAAGEQLLERANGDRYRMRFDSPRTRPNGYPDFGGDLSPVSEPTLPEAELDRALNPDPPAEVVDNIASSDAPEAAILDAQLASPESKEKVDTSISDVLGRVGVLSEGPMGELSNADAAFLAGVVGDVPKAEAVAEPELDDGPTDEDVVLEIEDELHEAGVFYNGMRGEDHPASMDSYGTITNFVKLNQWTEKNLSRFSLGQIDSAAKYWRANTYLSPNMGLLVAFFEAANAKRKTSPPTPTPTPTPADTAPPPVETPKRRILNNPSLIVGKTVNMMTDYGFVPVKVLSLDADGLMKIEGGIGDTEFILLDDVDLQSIKDPAPATPTPGTRVSFSHPSVSGDAIGVVLPDPAPAGKIKVRAEGYKSTVTLPVGQVTVVGGPNEVAWERSGKSFQTKEKAKLQATLSSSTLAAKLGLQSWDIETRVVKSPDGRAWTIEYRPIKAEPPTPPDKPRLAPSRNPAIDNSTVTAELNAHNFQQGTTAFLSSVAATGPKHLRPVAKLLLEFPELLAATPVTLVHLPKGAFAGALIPSTGQVLINTAMSGPRGTVDTLLHELLHAATVQSIKNPTPAQAKILQRLDRVRQSVQKRAKGDKRLEYATSSLDEFVTHFFTSPEFQQQVAAMTPKGQKSWVQVIIDTIRELLGARRKSAADATLEGVMNDMIVFTRDAAARQGGKTPGPARLQPGRARARMDNPRAFKFADIALPETTQAWNDLRETRRTAEITLLREEIGLTQAQAETLHDIAFVQDGEPTRWSKRNLNPEQQGRLDQFFEESPYNRVDGPVDIWDYDSYYNPELVDGETDPSALSRDLVLAFTKGLKEEPSDKYVWAVAAVRRLKEIGATRKDLSDALAAQAGRVSGSDSTAKEWYATHGKALNDLVNRYAPDMPMTRGERGLYGPNRADQLLLLPGTPAPDGGASIRDTVRFYELTAGMDETPDGIEKFKVEQPEKYAELERMRAEVLRRQGYTDEAWQGSEGGIGPVYKKGLFNPKIRTSEDRNNFGFYFAKDEADAKQFAGRGGEVRHVWLSMKNPLDLRGLDSFAGEDIQQELDSAGVKYDFNGGEEMEVWMNLLHGDKALSKAIQKAGYDGVIFNEFIRNTDRNVHVVFNPNQIKSASPLNLDPTTGKLIPPNQWGNAGSSDIRFLPGTEAAGTQFNNEINKYVTGEWPATSHGRMAKINGFLRSWISDKYPNIPIRHSDVPGGTSYLRLRGRSEQEIVIGSDDAIRLSVTPEATESEAYDRIASGVDEEVIHWAHTQAILERLGNPEDSNDAIYNDILETAKSIVEAPTNVDDRRVVSRGLASLMELYYKKEYSESDRENAATLLGDMVRDQPDKAFVVVSELVRAVVQMRRTGRITESTFARMWDNIKQWFTDRINAVKELLGRPEILGTRVNQDIKAIEAILDEMGAKRQPPTTAQPDFTTTQGVRDTALGYIPENVNPDDLNIDYDELAGWVEGHHPANAEDIIRSTVGLALDHKAGVDALGPDADLEEVQRFSDTLGRIARGNTAQSDIDFYRSNPSVLARLVRYLTAALKSAWARLALRWDARTAVMIDRTTRSLWHAENGFGNREVQVDSSIASRGILALPGKRIRFDRSIEELQRLAVDSEGFKSWFSDFKEYLQEFLGEHGEYAPLVNEFLSATSAATQVAVNVPIMVRILKKFLETGEIDTSFMAHKLNLERAARGEQLSGPKISEYSDAVFGNTEAIPVDRHIAQIMFGTDKPTGAQIEAAKGRVRKIAKKLGWEPRQVMAALWAANQKINDLPSESYERHLNKFREELHAAFTSDRTGEGRGIQAARRIAERIRKARGVEGGSGGDAGGIRLIPSNTPAGQVTPATPATPVSQLTAFTETRQGEAGKKGKPGEAGPRKEGGNIPVTPWDTVVVALSRSSDLTRSAETIYTAKRNVLAAHAQQVGSLGTMVRKLLDKVDPAQRGRVDELINLAAGSSRPLLTAAEDARITRAIVVATEAVKEEEEAAKDGVRKTYANAYAKAKRVATNERLAIADDTALQGREELKAQDEVLKRLEKTHDELREKRDKAITAIYNNTKDSLREIREAERDMVNQAKFDEASRIRLAQDQAVHDLNRIDPNLGEGFRKFRMAINELQSKLADDPNVPESLKELIQLSIGTYLTRKFEIHGRPGFGEAIRTSPEHAGIRNALIGLFQSNLVEREMAILRGTDQFSGLAYDEVTPELDAAAAEARVDREVRRLSRTPDFKGKPDDEVRAVAESNVAEQAEILFEEFILGHEGRRKSGVGMSDIRLEFERYMKKTDLPKEILDALGEVRDPIINLTTTYNAVSNLLATHRALAEYKAAAIAGGWIISKEEKESGNRKYDGWEELVSKNPDSPAYAPLAGWYASPEQKAAFDANFKSSQKPHNNTADTLFKKGMDQLYSLAGVSLGVVTLGNPAKYVRDMIGGYIMAAAQGALPFSSGNRSNVTTWQAAFGGKTGSEMEDYANELIALGVLNNGVHIGMLKDAFAKMGDNPHGFLNALQEVMAKGNTKVGEFIGASREKSKEFVEMLGKLSQFTESIGNISVFERELSVLREAKWADTEAALKQEAARRTRMVMPSKDQASQAVTGFTKTPLGLVLAPFIRFKAEMIRTVFNTYKLAWQDIKSDNPVMKAHGVKRFASAGVVHGALTFGLSIAVQALMGIGDDEDRAIRAAMPGYAKNSSFIYLKRGNGLTTLDLTYLNPFSFTFDPFTQATKAIANGRFDDLPKIAARFLGTELLGENITASTILDISRNMDDSTNQPIYLDSDTDTDKIYKMFTHVLGGAYYPAILKKPVQAGKALSRPEKEDDPFFYTPAGVLATLVVPIKPRDYKIEDLAYRAMSNLRKANTQLWMHTAPLKSPAPMNPDNVEGLYKQRMDASRRIYGQMWDLAKGYEKLGMSRAAIMRKATDAGFSRDKVGKVILNGVMDRPVLNDETLAKMNKIDPARVTAWQKAVAKYPPLIKVGN